ncbi:MAG: HAD family hydrolase [Planctomycetes bacterium]|nr:HAD family hydrolase [Planctomycetota bacterium]
MRRAVFLDRDGTITHEGDWGAKAKAPRMIPGAAEALRRLRDAGFLLFVVTNQSGVARGYYTEDDVRAYHRRMEEIFAEAGVRFEEIAYCPHMPEAGCACRKPGTRFLAEAAARHGIDLARSFIVGDQTTDVELGARNGCTTILVRTGFGGDDGKLEATPDYVVADIAEAAEKILAVGGGSGSRRTGPVG